jgi:hypothetical protein
MSIIWIFDMLQRATADDDDNHDGDNNNNIFSITAV